MTVYPAEESNGNAANATISGPATALNYPAAIAIDSAKNIYVTNDGTLNGAFDSVTVYTGGDHRQRHGKRCYWFLCE